MKTLLALTAAAVAFTAAPAEAKQHSNYNNNRTVCTKWRHGTCVASHQVGLNRAQQVHQRNSARQQARLFATGQRVPRNYGYWTPYNQIPQNYVTQYDLNSNYRYINRGGYIYVVDPQTYAVRRVIEALTR
jgi:Ni/Co efflux regulator RcnB